MQIIKIYKQLIDVLIITIRKNGYYLQLLNSEEDGDY